MSLTLKEYTSELWVKIKSFISTNYSTKANTISGLTVSGKVITYTKGDGSTGTITTQDTNTTYGNMTAATASAAGKAGLVPAPAAGKQTSFLRGDGKWVVPTNTTYSFSNKAATLAWNNAVTVATVGGVDITVKLPANPNTDTHWTTTMYAGAKDAKSNAATTNGNSYIKLFDNSTVRAQLNIKGSGATRVTTDANGAITISSTDTNTTYSKLSQFTNDSGYITGAGSCSYSTESGHANLLATYADDGHFLCPDRYDGWNTRLYMTYGDKSVKADNVHVHHADYSSRSAGNGAFYISGYQIYVG